MNFRVTVNMTVSANGFDSNTGERLEGYIKKACTNLQKYGEEWENIFTDNIIIDVKEKE